MGRPRLPEQERKAKRSQSAKDYRNRNADKVNAYEQLRKEKRKLERLYKAKAFVVNDKENQSQSLESKTKLIEVNERNNSQSGIINLSCKKEEPMMGQTFKRNQHQLLLDILNNMDCMLDIQVICIDGSFMWSRLLLSRLSPYMNVILKKGEDIDALIVDNGMKGKTVHDALINLLQVKPEWNEDYQNVYQLFCVPVTSEFEKESNFNEHFLSCLKVEVSDDDFDISSENHWELYESSKVEEENKFTEQSFLSPNGNIENTENFKYEKHENSHYDTSVIDKFKNKIKLKSTVNPKENKDKVKKRKIKTSEKETVWIREPSPERFISGQKVKYICVTQQNIASGPPYFCIGCNYKSNLIINVKKHYRRHSNEKPFACKVCGKNFSTSNNVFSHWNNRHNDNRKKDFSCDVCGLLFSVQSQLIRHRMVHSGETFVCKVCGKAFDSPWSRDSHELRHKEEVVPCPICGKEFANKGSVERHQVRHGGSRNYQCELCEKTCKTEGDLRNHKRIKHSEGGHFDCTVCGKLFKQKHYRDNHVKIVHEKSTRFQCLLCPQVLSTKQHYKRHSLRCHDGQMMPVSNRVN